MRNIFLFLFTVSTSSCVPIPADGASDRAGLFEVSGFIGQPKEERGYYPDFKQYGREQAVQEQEHWISKIDSVYNRAQNKAASYLNIRPLVDTIQEHEKYGNDGEPHRKVAQALVAGFDILGNTINSVVDLPFKANDYAGKTINAALDAFGAKLVGI